eukprot:10416598-Prorocentrum_lima.AAC.1
MPPSAHAVPETSVPKQYLFFASSEKYAYTMCNLQFFCILDTIYTQPLINPDMYFTFVSTMLLQDIANMLSQINGL